MNVCVYLHMKYLGLSTVLKSKLSKFKSTRKLGAIFLMRFEGSPDGEKTIQTK